MEYILPHIRKPLRYIGNEVGSIHKDWNKASIKFAICYPDLYELGMSCLGVRVIYFLLNSFSDIICERVFAPWTDLEQWLRNTHTPLVSLESMTPLNKFDCIGFSLQHELTYTNVLNMLDLSKIPIHSEERVESDPLIIAGGPGTLNPFPMIRFFDCFFIGEAEPTIPKFIECMKEWKNKKLKKEELLLELSKTPGIFIPKISKNVKRQWTQELQNEKFHKAPIVPFIEIERDSLVVEISRGCTRGCRFCQAGMVTRPYRERNVESILELVKSGTKNTGYRDVSLLSLSASDHSQLIEIIKRIKALGIEPSLPSLRGDSLTDKLANLVGKGGITFAPETGTDKLRKIINKDTSESQILNSCELASSHGFTHTKLYYMIGLPGENDEDINGIVKLTKQIAKIMRGKQVNVAIAPFVPRPHTPFQWEPQESVDKLRDKVIYIKDSLHKGNIKVKYRDLYMSFIEGICARGDEQVSELIEEAWRRGAKFDGWGDKFNFSYWEDSFEKLGINPYTYIGGYSEDAHLPWEIIDVGVKKGYLLEERKKTAPTIDCRIAGCTKCGVCNSPNPIPMEREAVEKSVISYGRAKKQAIEPEVKLRFRLKFEKSDEMRFLGHLDLVRAIERAIIRAEIPIAYSKGFKPRPVISFSPPLPFGVTSKEEYLDISLKSTPHGDIKCLLNCTLPKGIQIIDVTQLWEAAKSSFEEFKKCIYRIQNVNIPEQKIHEFMAKDEIIGHEINLRLFVIDIKKENNSITLLMQIGKAKPWWILESLLEISEEQAIDFKIERIRLL
ncbi:MAG: TIGR03936 family radical SAM-associated protein [bacterium]|nr:TIGR03936 family radical SAM-associated protein [bacterium]